MAVLAAHVISKKVENRKSLNKIAFLDTHVSINNP